LGLVHALQDRRPGGGINLQRGEGIPRSAGCHQSSAGAQLMPQVPAPWGEWRPDIALLDNQYARDVESVFPLSDTYTPLRALIPFSGAIVPPPPLDEPILGLASVRTTS